ncbi:MAG: septum site-determining protein MinD [Deltaproteobacteria bacterium]|jgi:septum site-determining protein MinD|nr:septum site-determining protein MinD [Deltaproteobacteria bacterium]MBK9649392.1 septum site-determining protein MinD [Deltaproteobacteria bacterium]MCK6514950.1 septum site-determining protein MinD [Myxococcota bacterium]
MSECIVITSGKGGVGKTTTSANLSVSLAMMGHKVAVVDADIGLRNLDVILGLENRIVYDLVHVIEGECRLKQALIRDKRLENLFLLPAAQTRDKSAVNPEQMRKLVEQLKAEFDYVIIDCPAGIEQGFKNSIAGADKAIIVTTPEVSAIRDADRIIGLVEAAELPEPRLIINRFRQKMVDRGDMLNKDDILEILAIPLIGVVPDHEDIIVSANRGAPVAFDDTSVVGEAYRRIARRVSGEADVPFVALQPVGIWENVKRWMGLSAKAGV